MSTYKKQVPVNATYMRGGTSKGLFFTVNDLPQAAQQAGSARDQLLMRVIGSPDPYKKQIDGMGGATSSTSKTVLLSRSSSPKHDVDYLFGQVAIDRPFVDWSGNCGNLSAAVGPYAVRNGLVDVSRIPENGIAEVRIWQVNIQKTIIARVPIINGQVQELGDFVLDGVTFPAAEVQVEFLDPASSLMLPTGNVVDTLTVPGFGSIPATFINAGIPTIFLNAADLGYTGTEKQSDINSDVEALKQLETLRAYGALQMGLIDSLEQAQTQQHTPKIAWVAPPQTYQASNGDTIDKNDIDVLVRAMSMGQLHHAMMGTAAVAISVAAAIPDTLVNLAASQNNHSIDSDSTADIDSTTKSVRFGHPSGTLKVGAEVTNNNNQWTATKAVMSRSARVLMTGQVWVPENN